MTTSLSKAARSYFLMSLDQAYAPFYDVMEALQSVQRLPDQVLIEDDRKGVLRVTCNGKGLRRDFSSPVGQGFAEYLWLSDDLFVSLHSITPLVPIYHRTKHDRSISFGTQLHGMQEVTPVHNTDQDNLIILGAMFDRDSLETILRVGETFTAINFASSCHENPTILGVQTPDLDLMLMDCIEEESEYLSMCFTHHTASRALRHCTNEMLSAFYQGQLRHDFLKAKATEFVCHFEAQCSKIRTEKTEKSEPTYKFSQSDVEALQKISRNIRNFPGDDLKIKNLAMDVNLSENKLIALFKRYYNESIHQYVIRIRMERAKKYLLETDLSIKDISRKVGYSDLSGFGRAYKKFFGVGPSTTRRM